LRITAKSFEEHQADRRNRKKEGGRVNRKKLEQTGKPYFPMPKNRKASLEKRKEKERQQAISNKWAIIERADWFPVTEKNTATLLPSIDFRTFNQFVEQTIAKRCPTAIC
jgi:hypothetical protein